MKSNLEVKLFAPKEYWQLTREQLDDISNGCGGSGVGALVPDSFFGLSVKPACDIHDFMYHVGKGDQGKIDADEVLLNNMIRICNEQFKVEKRMWLYKIRLNLCQKYYYVVDKCGGPWYWAGKNEPEEEGSVVIKNRSLIF